MTPESKPEERDGTAQEPGALVPLERERFYGDAEPLPQDAGPGGKSAWLRVLAATSILCGAFMLGAWATGHNAAPPAQTVVAGSPKNSAAPLLVHVAGRVKNPGVYALPLDARVQDALSKAGGALPDADLNAVNLAAWIEDGAKITVPAKAAPPPTPLPVLAATAPPRLAEAPTAPPAAPAPKIEKTAAPPQRSPSALFAGRRKIAGAARPAATRAKPADGIPRAVTSSGRESKKADPLYLEKHQLDLNAATAEQLVLLPGIGPAMAQKILDYRAQNGAFKSVADLQNVRGIGPKKMDALRPLLAVTGDKVTR